MNVLVFDYGVGNLHSLTRALEAGCGRPRVEVASDAACATTADALVLPGVGAFSHAVERLESDRETIHAALERGLPCLGICLGMQILFERSDEGPGRGLGVLPGRVRRLSAGRVPHMGWNALEPATIPTATSAVSAPSGTAGAPATEFADPLLAGLPEDPVVYYAHSFVVAPDPGMNTDVRSGPQADARVCAWTRYAGDRFPAVVRRGRTWGVQFHPEKSGAVGSVMIRNFLEAAEAAP